MIFFYNILENRIPWNVEQQTMTSLWVHHHAIRLSNHFSTPEFPIGATVLGRGSGQGACEQTEEEEDNAPSLLPPHNPRRSAMQYPGL